MILLWLIKKLPRKERSAYIDVQNQVQLTMSSRWLLRHQNSSRNTHHRRKSIQNTSFLKRQSNIFIFNAIYYMLTIRLARVGRRNLAMFRVVLTEHSKPSKCGYKEVLGSYNPLSHTLSIDVDAVKKYVSQWASLSERVAKLLYKQTNDQMYTKFFSLRESVSKTKNPDKHNV